MMVWPMGEIGLTRSPNLLTGTNGIMNSGKARNVLNGSGGQKNDFIDTVLTSKNEGYFC